MTTNTTEDRMMAEPSWAAALREHHDALGYHTRWRKGEQLPEQAWTDARVTCIQEACDATQTLLGAAFRPALFRKVRDAATSGTLSIDPERFASEVWREDRALALLRLLSPTMAGVDLIDWLRGIGDWLALEMTMHEARIIRDRLVAAVLWQVGATLDEYRCEAEAAQ